MSGTFSNGSSLAAAKGQIVIDVSQLTQAQAGVNSFAQNVTVTLNQINNSSNQAQKGVNSLFAAFGIGAGAAGLSQLGRFALDANAIATAFDRQTVAARNLAGGQEHLNALLAAYGRATDGAVDKAQAMADVTKLQAVGLADNAQQLERFVTAARGASIATGRSTQDILGEVQLAVANQSFRRLDQIGLSVQEVRARMEELKASTAGMTDEAAFQEAVIEKLTEKYGALAKSAEAAPTGIEAATIALKDFRTEFGEMTKGVLDFTGDAFANWLKQTTADIKTLTDWIGPFIHQFQELSWMLQGKSIAFQNGLSIRQPSLLPSAANFNMPSGDAVNPKQPEIDAAKRDWVKGILQLNNDTNQQLLQQNQDYQEQRADSEKQFQTTTLRAQEDFGIQRQREEQDLADSIDRIHRDSAEREEREAEDLARSIAQAESDSADKVADAKKDTAKQLAELDENYAKEREKRAKDLNDNLLDAAGDLDAKQVYQLQRNAAVQEDEAKQAHDDQRNKLQEQLQERLDDEAKSLAKSIRQQQDAYDRQIQDGRDADAQRITDMQADFAKRRDQENADYGLRMDRMRKDHNDQLSEMDRQQTERITQIQTHAQQERDQLDDEHKRTLDDLSDHNTEYHNAIVKADDDALKEFDRLTHPVRVWLKAPTQPLVTPNLANAYAVPGAYAGGVGGSYSSNSNSFSPTVNVNIAGGSSLTQKQIDDAVHDALIRVYQEIAQ